MKSTATKWLAILLAFAIIHQDFAATPGSYVGAGLGYSKLNTPSQPLFFQGGASKVTQQVGGLGLRGYGGYNFNPYFGIEAGLADYAPSKYYGHASPANSSLEYSMTVMDIVGKTYLPLGQSGFDLYALAGVAGIEDKIETVDNTNKYHKLRPKVGVGVSYAIPKSNVSTSIELTHIEGTGNLNSNPHALPSSNAVMLNFTYNFD